MIFLNIIELLISYMISCSARFQMTDSESRTRLSHAAAATAHWRWRCSGTWMKQVCQCSKFAPIMFCEMSGFAPWLTKVCLLKTSSLS